jgi:hypothetical protein
MFPSLIHRLRREAQPVTESEVPGEEGEGEDSFYDPTAIYEDEQSTMSPENVIKKNIEELAQKIHSKYLLPNDELQIYK